MGKTPKKVNFTKVKRPPKKVKKPASKRLKIDMPFQEAIQAAFTPKSDPKDKSRSK